MTTFIPATGTAAGTVFSLGGLWDSLVVLPDVTLVSTGGAALRGYADNAFTIHGTVHGDRGGIVMGEEVPGGNVFVGGTGNVSSAGAYTIFGTFGPDQSNGDYTLTNNGDISLVATGDRTGPDGGATVWFQAYYGGPDQDWAPSQMSVVNNGIIANGSTLAGGNAIHYQNVNAVATIANAAGGVISSVSLRDAAILIEGTSVASADGGRLSSVINVDNAGDILSGGIAYMSAGEGIDLVHNTGRIFGQVNLGVDDDVFIGRGGEVFGTVLGGKGNDLLVGGSHGDELDGGAGLDVLRGLDGDDHLLGDTENDRLFGGAGDDTLDGGGNNDLIYGGDGADVALGGYGADTVYGGAGDDALAGENGADTLYGGDGDDSLDGGAGFDLLRGGAGADALDGGSGADTLAGGTGDDTLTGGANPDTFVFAFGGGHDLVTDYTDNVDKIDLSAMGFTSFAADIQPFMFQSGADVVIDLSFGALANTITLETELLANIGPGDFIF